METRNVAKLNIDISFIDQFLQRMIKFGFSGTLLIAEEDKILLNKGYGYRNFENELIMRSDTVMSIGSISKQFTSTAIMKLVEEGKIEVSDTVDKFFQTAPKDKSKITIDQLLTHRSGLISDLGGDHDLISKADYLDLLFSSELQSEPGTNYSYSNCGYSLLACIIEEVIEMGYQTYLSKKLLEPLGIINVGWFGDNKWTDENSTNYYVDGINTGSVKSWGGKRDSLCHYWNILGNGGVCISAKDLFLWIRAVMTGKIVSPSYIQAMTNPKQGDYGYGWRVVDSEFGKIIRHNGGSDQGVNAVAQYFTFSEITIIIISNVVQNGYGTGFQFESILNRIIRGDRIDLPPKTSNHRLETLQLKDEKSKDQITVFKNKLNQVFAGIKGQGHLNQILGISNDVRKVYDHCNAIIEQYGNYLKSEDFSSLFQLTTRKQADLSRTNFLKMLKREISNEYGTIFEIKCGGTIPSNEYFASSFLIFECENGSKGIPVIWANENEILGIRPMLADYPITFALAKDDQGTVLGYNGLYSIGYNFSDYVN